MGLASRNPWYAKASAAAVALAEAQPGISDPGGLALSANHAPVPSHEAASTVMPLHFRATAATAYVKAKLRASTGYLPVPAQPNATTAFRIDGVSRDSGADRGVGTQTPGVGFQSNSTVPSLKVLMKAVEEQRLKDGSVAKLRPGYTDTVAGDMVHNMPRGGIPGTCMDPSWHLEAHATKRKDGPRQVKSKTAHESHSYTAHTHHPESIKAIDFGKAMKLATKKPKPAPPNTGTQKNG